MKLVIGDMYKVKKNRNSYYGRCTDIIAIEGQEVELYYKEIFGQGIRIKDKHGRIHFCEEENLEQITHNKERENRKMKFKVGDIVTGVAGSDDRYDITNTKMTKGEVVDVGESCFDEDTISIKILEYLSKDKNSAIKDDIKNNHIYTVLAKYFKLVSSRLDVTFDFKGTTTIAKTKDSEGVAKLYHGEKYSKGYGIAVALGRALGIDIVDEVLKVNESYKTETKKLIISDFSVGDKVKIKTGLEVGRYYDNADIFVSQMKDYEGKVATVMSIDISRNKMRLNEFGYLWTPSMLDIIEKADVKKVELNKFKAGDKVRIRSWDDMEKQFGLDSDGDIKCDVAFTTGMKDLCGKEFTINSIDSDNSVYGHDYSWDITTDMIELVENIADKCVGQELNAEEAKDILIHGGEVRRSNSNLSYFLQGSKLYFYDIKDKEGKRRKLSSTDGITLEDKYFITKLPKHFYKVGDEIEDIEEVEEFIKLGGKVKDEDNWTFWYKDDKLKEKDNNNEKQTPDIDDMNVPVTIIRLPKVGIVKKEAK